MSGEELPSPSLLVRGRGAGGEGAIGKMRNGDSLQQTHLIR